MTGDLAWSSDDAREFDRRAIEDYGLPGLVLMENAGRGASDWVFARRAELGLSASARVAVLCGQGNNGGDGFVMARHLALAGFSPVIVEFGQPKATKPDKELFRSVCHQMNLPLLSAEEASRPEGPLEGAGAPELWVDCVLGTGFKGSLRGKLAHELELFGVLIRRSTAQVVALDLPSGLDADTGEVKFAHIRADFTLAFGALKVGFKASEAVLKLGEVAVLPLGAPLD